MLSDYTLLFLSFAAIWAIWWVLIQMKKERTERERDDLWIEFLEGAGLVEKEKESE